MRIGITGASGFLGSWLCHFLSKKHDVFAYVRSNSDLSRLRGQGSFQIKSFNPKSSPIFDKDKLETLLMLDWEGVQNNYRDLNSQFDNVERQNLIINNASRAGIKTIIGFGSHAELGTLNSLATEKSSDNPTTQYGKAKVSSRMQLIKECSKKDMNWLWCRIFSTYGPRDSKSWLIPGMINSIARDKPFLLTMCQQEWSFLHVWDFYTAISRILQVKPNQIINVGNPETVKISDVVKMIGELTGRKDLLKIGAIPYRSDQVMFLKPECTILKDLGWSPDVDLMSGITHMIDSDKSKSEIFLSLKNNSKVLI